MPSTMFGEIIFLVAAYLFGSFPLMLLVSKAKGVDLSQEGDYHIAMYRKVGRVAGIVGIAADVLKGILTVLVGYLLGFSILVVAASGVLATLGQMWPVFQKFNGEKGNTTGGGVVFIYSILYHAPWIIGVGLIVGGAGFLIRTIPRFLEKGQTFNQKLGFGGPPSNSLPLAMILGFALFPLVSFLIGEPVEITFALLIIFVAIVIRRLTAGVMKDIRKKDSSACRILCNRLLFDRSYY
jgi:acyl phosphate:glycerol-3-phosphate acyltransferase